MVWLYMRQRRLGEARQFAASWADKTEPRFSRATVLELIMWGRFLLSMAAAAVRDNAMGEAEDALLLAGAAAARIGREVRRHESSQCVFGPVSVGYIKAETFMVAGRPRQCLAVAASLPARPPFPDVVDRLRHKLDAANAHATLGEYGEAFTILQGLRGSAPGWLAHQVGLRPRHHRQGRLRASHAHPGHARSCRLPETSPLAEVATTSCPGRPVP